MTNSVLGGASAGFVSVSAVLVIVVYAFIAALVIICLVRASNYFRSARKEQKLIRMELGKVAEEVHLIRQQLTSLEEQGPLAKSE